MNIDLVITQLKTAGYFSGNVAGAADFVRAVKDQVWLDMPAAYVVQGDLEAVEYQAETAKTFTVMETITIIVILDNTADRRGQTAIAGIDQTTKALFGAILNWRPDSSVDNPGNSSVQLDYETRGFQFLGGRLADMDLARLFYEFDFGVRVTFGPEDGWQPSSTGLTSIKGTFTAGTDGEVLTSTTLTPP